MLMRIKCSRPIATEYGIQVEALIFVLLCFFAALDPTHVKAYSSATGARKTAVMAQKGAYK
jgi:hypothetical protein